MPLVSPSEVIAPARAAGHGVGAFNVVQIEHAEAIVTGAERVGAPVVLQISENTLRYHGRPEPLGLAALAVARAAAVPVVVHLDHATDPELVRRAAALGYTSVMIDASALPYEDNLAVTREVTRRCHAAGVWVEAELGEIGGKGGAHAPDARTDPSEAAAFVAATGVDTLAVAVGSSHAMRDRVAVLDHGLLAELRRRVPVPLVLHGSSGVPDEGLRAAVAHGITKVNVSTHLNRLFTEAVRDRLARDPGLVDTRTYLGAGREAAAREVARLLVLLGAARLPVTATAG
ncbi:class II fructose-bisphosphate aldolase (plasmid) [Streptomyces sp. BI20]|uniref:class II fructose-bisphosphate aldolase n=1 Tax=Streptomyces sp. BI20 TaxID=3403460 RepID=UPI003C75865E